MSLQQGYHVNVHAFSSQSEFEEDGDPTDLIYIPIRGVFSSLGSTEGVAVVPKFGQVITFIYQFRKIMRQAISNPNLPMPYIEIDQGEHYLLDRAIRDQPDEVLARYRKLFRDQPANIWPYVNNHFARAWVQDLREKGLDASMAFSAQIRYPHPQNRGGWGRLWSSNAMPGFAETYNIPYPRSYVVEDAAEMAEAFAALGGETVWAKPVFGSGGYTNMRLERPGDIASFYDALIGFGQFEVDGQRMLVEVQEDLRQMFDGVSGLRFGSLQYHGGRILTPGDFTLQRIDDAGQWFGNDYNVQLPEVVTAQLWDIWRKFQAGMKGYYGQENFNDIGGIDFAIAEIPDQDPRVVVVENNGGRQTGASTANAMARLLEVENFPFTGVKINGADGIEVEQIWQLLKEQDLNLMKGQRYGAIPLVWVDGSHMIFIAAESHEVIDGIYNQIQELVNQRGAR